MIYETQNAVHTEMLRRDLGCHFVVNPEQHDVGRGKEDDVTHRTSVDLFQRTHVDSAASVRRKNLGVDL